MFLHKTQNIYFIKGFLCTLLITGSASICGNFSPQGKSGDPKGEKATNTIPISWQNRLQLKLKNHCVSIILNLNASSFFPKINSRFGQDDWK